MIEIGEHTGIEKVELWIEDNHNRIAIGKRTSLCGKAHLACIEGCTITIGDNCLFSSDVVFRTGDSHSVLDLNGSRINPSQDISIGNRVWICNRVIVAKGVSIREDSIIGAGSVVTKSIPDTNVVIAGIPAKVVKREVSWCAERIERKEEYTMNV